MADLRRLCSEPLPAIRPVKEVRAEGQPVGWYAEVKAALEVPWMGVMTMAYAHHPAVFGELWRGFGPLIASTPFVPALWPSREGRTMLDERP